MNRTPRFFWKLPVCVTEDEKAAAQRLAEQACGEAVAAQAGGMPFNAELRRGCGAWDSAALDAIDALAKRVAPLLEATVAFEPAFTVARLWVSCAGGEGMPFHVDRSSPAQTKPAALIRVLVALTPATSENCTEFLSLGAAQDDVVAEAWKRHNRVRVGEAPASEHDVPYRVWAKAAPDAARVLCLMERWDVVAIDGARYMHRRRENTGNSRRMILALDFVDRITESHVQKHRRPSFSHVIPRGFPVDNKPPSLGSKHSKLSCTCKL